MGNEGGLAGFVIWYDCVEDNMTYDKLVAELEKKAAEWEAKEPCTWLGKIGAPCTAPPKECGNFPDAVLPPCRAPCSKTDFFNVTIGGAPVIRNLGGLGPDTA